MSNNIQNKKYRKTFINQILKMCMELSNCPRTDIFLSVKTRKIYFNYSSSNNVETRLRKISRSLSESKIYKKADYPNICNLLEKREKNRKKICQEQQEEDFDRISLDSKEPTMEIDPEELEAQNNEYGELIARKWIDIDNKKPPETKLDPEFLASINRGFPVASSEENPINSIQIKPKASDIFNISKDEERHKRKFPENYKRPTRLLPEKRSTKTNNCLSSSYTSFFLPNQNTENNKNNEINENAENNEIKQNTNNTNLDGFFCNLMEEKKKLI
jgi:hypothetical protein